MKRVITATVVAAVPLVVAVAQLRADPWSMFEGAEAVTGFRPPAIDLGPVQQLENGVRCHLRWTPEAGQMRQRWVRSTMSLTAAGANTSVDVVTRYRSEAAVSRTYGEGVLIHRSIASAARRIATGVRDQLELAWARAAQSADDDSPC